MDWKTASIHYAKRLEDALTIRRYASQLAQLSQVRTLDGINDISRVLNDEGKQAERQKKRLDKGEFRIAVVGLEKAGKSTFVNAWLGCDLLPTKSQRCTFTTTQIYSVPDDSNQRLEVDPKTYQAFERLCRELEATKNGTDRSQAEKAEADLQTIRKNDHTLKKVLEEPPLRESFINLEDIKNDLRKYVADACYAHAIQEARLFTSRLAEAEGIVFYDVPGLDSGLAKHIEESREMLTDCDAVILIQRYPSLRGHEKDLIKFAREGDKHIGLEEKLFVFFARMDSFASHEAFKKDYEAVVHEWQQEKNALS
ncbi:dynamin family protein [Rhodopseudomonas palustris]|uniref:Dynamin family protein n=1 Tax=Thiospirillum jenense TaxID=1653858 RepID=A0A839HC71_9GAMM|nr:dynamin family protein [Thiospirillum jenense]MBB1089697.1 dynamin family protein [Rhodopseudomonas palustris]MBB1124797.1 dynamin family protein [Thiospirillum jenense]